MLRLPRRRAVLVAAPIVVSLFALSPGAALQARATLTIVAENLVNPRGLNFGPEGALYVAEAGSGGPGPCISDAGSESCYGPTGAVTRITLGSPTTQTRIVTGLPSRAGATGAGATGPHDVEFQGRGNGFVTIGLGADPEVRFDNPTDPEFLSVGRFFGRLVRFKPNGKYSFEEDLAGFESAANPDGAFVDSNPYGLLALPGRQVFADAGGNALNAVAANGSITNLAVFPNRMVQNPFAPPGVMMPLQAVPTSVALGPDGDLFVGQLTGFPFPVGGASVYRVFAKGGEATVYASGFTNIIDIAFGPDGSLYVLQLDANSLRLPGSEGSLIRVTPDGTRSTVVAAGEGLVAPGGIAIARDGSIYVTNYSTSIDGTVVKVIS